MICVFQQPGGEKRKEPNLYYQKGEKKGERELEGRAHTRESLLNSLTLSTGLFEREGISILHTAFEKESGGGIRQTLFRKGRRAFERAWDEENWRLHYLKIAGERDAGFSLTSGGGARF